MRIERYICCFRKKYKRIKPKRNPQKIILGVRGNYCVIFSKNKEGKFYMAKNGKHELNNIL